MKPVTKCWINVQEHMYIRSKEGVVWRVERVKRDSHHMPTHYGLRNRAGETRILEAPNPDAPITIMMLTEEEKYDLLVEQLGAELIEQYFPDIQGGIWWCEPFEEKRTLGEMKFHLEYFHGVPGRSANDPGTSAGMNSRKALIEAHELTMAEPQRLHVPHIHTKRSEIPFP